MSWSEEGQKRDGGFLLKDSLTFVGEQDGVFHTLFHVSPCRSIVKKTKKTLTSSIKNLILKGKLKWK